uniref:Uncharacterized protein n=1 Tax=Anguilla anguilla TaxID=7936 RepID=A0A0E9QH04_ANGAN
MKGIPLVSFCSLTLLRLFSLSLCDLNLQLCCGSLQGRA